uniref:C-type lectin domain-containing protein n=1 Tax=Acrobeloides nanus TaxID=290746 RepID=A0A914BX35_9BILA
MGEPNGEFSQEFCVETIVRLDKSNPRNPTMSHSWNDIPCGIIRPAAVCKYNPHLLDSEESNQNDNITNQDLSSVSIAPTTLKSYSTTQTDDNLIAHLLDSEESNQNDNTTNQDLSSVSIAPTTPKSYSTTQTDDNLIDKECEQGWTYFNFTQSCYKVLKKVNFTLALEQCYLQSNQNNGSLVSIHSDDENEFVNDLVEQADEWNNTKNIMSIVSMISPQMLSTPLERMGLVPLTALIGIHEPKYNKLWRWTDGSKVDYITWSVENSYIRNTEGICVATYVRFLRPSPNAFYASNDKGLHRWIINSCSDIVPAAVCKYKPHLHDGKSNNNNGNANQDLPSGSPSAAGSSITPKSYSFAQSDENLSGASLFFI